MWACNVAGSRGEEDERRVKEEHDREQRNLAEKQGREVSFSSCSTQTFQHRVGRQQPSKLEWLFQTPWSHVTPNRFQRVRCKKEKKEEVKLGSIFLDSCSADARSRGYKRSSRKCNHKIKAAFNRSNQCFYISRSTPCFHQAWSILLINLPCVRLISNCLCNVQMFKKHL